jgi:signal transduction histidine kinase
MVKPQMINNLANVSRFGTQRVTERDSTTSKTKNGNPAPAETGDPPTDEALGKEVCMQQMEQELRGGFLEPENVDAALQDLPILGRYAESLAQVAHDARNMVTALNLYCDLLQEPGVLSAPFSHYGSELKHVAATSRVLVERLAALNGTNISARDAALIEPSGSVTQRGMRGSSRHTDTWNLGPAVPIDNLAAEVLANRNLLGALVGATVGITIDVEGSALPVRLASEDLTRILVNLAKNAAEAMSSVGRIHISLRESVGDSVDASWLTLNVEDNGPGFPDRLLANIFDLGESVHASHSTMRGDWPVRQRGLGLSITRLLVEAAGGRIHAANRDPVGACIQIELPVRKPCELPLRTTGDNASFN